jgi:hypothetical protein
MIEDGLSYPFRDEWIGRTIIGGVLGFFSFLILPAIVLLGYIVDALRATAQGSDSAPEFSDWGQMIKDGFVALVILFVYSFVPTAVIGGIAVVFVGGGAALGGDGGGLLAGFGLISVLLAIPLLFIIYYTVPAALTAYATNDSVGAAFSFSILKPILLSGEYLVATFAPILIGVVIWIVTGVLSITVIGLVFVPFIQFIGQLSIARMFGLAYKSNANKNTT